MNLTCFKGKKKRAKLAKNPYLGQTTEGLELNDWQNTITLNYKSIYWKSMPTDDNWKTSQRSRHTFKYIKAFVFFKKK